MILGLLLGNTSVRYGVLDGASILRSGRIEWAELAARGGEIALAAEGRPVGEAVVASVRDDLLPSLAPWIPRDLLPPTFARRDFALPIENRYDRPEEAGTDRLLNAIAARERAPGLAAVAVDFGTAVSLSVVSREGAFLGGLIAAGARAIGNGLRGLTPRLPAVDPGDVRRPGGFVERSTAGALRAGIHLEVLGGVEAMLRGIRASLDGPARVFATGGEAPLFAPWIAGIDALVPDLTLEGLAFACRARASAP